MVRTTHSHSTKTPHETATATTPAMPSLPMPAPQMVATPVGRRERQPLRAWRERADDGRGWSQDTLARKASAVAEQRGAELGWDKTAVTVSAVAAIEQGRARPTLDTALILAETLGLLVQQIAWPPLAEVQAHPNSRHTRYTQGKAETEERLAVGRVVAHPVMGGGGVSLDGSLTLLREQLRALGVEDEEITRAEDRVRQKVAEGGQQERAAQPARRAPRIPTHRAPNPDAR